MESLDNILVCVKNPEETGGLLAHARSLCPAGSRRIHLLHVAPDAPPARGAGTPPPEPDRLTTDRLQTVAGKHMREDGQEEVICKVLAGSPLLEILRYAMEKDVDLIVLGRTPETEDHDTRLARRLATKATCSVLVVPENAKCGTGRVLVPVRNSECSARALETGCAIAAPGQGKVCCLNVFPIRGDYLEADLTLEEHTAMMRQWAERENRHLLESVATGGAQVVTLCSPDLYGRPATVILETIERASPELVVIGARGRTGAAGVLLGAVTEQLICKSPVPVLAVKKKGECIGILQALLSLAG